jgi:hypothetical protein
MRLHTVVAVVMLAAVACSSPDRARRMSPTAPSASSPAAVTLNDLGGISGPMDVRFPPRNETFEFRNQLETKYQTGLNRAPSQTYVDREGEVVWLQEYIRYRVNGCDHETAIRNVMTQIDGQPAAAICVENRNTLIIFPPRDQTMDFRRRLESKYQSMGRPLQSTYVDMEGSVIWTQEYLRYRVNECDHATATQKVMTQIDGGAVSDTCVPNCRYTFVPPDRELNSDQHSLSVDLLGVPGGCAWTAASDASWLTFPSDLTSGTNGLTIPYTVLQNVSGGPRTGRIRIAWQGGGTSHTVYQAGSGAITTFTMTDSFRSGSQPATECHFRSTATPCTFTAASNLSGAGAYTYSWTASYEYGGVTKTVTQLSTSPTFTITDACGAPEATAGGADGFLDVTLTVTDSLGVSQTVRSGQGMQPALIVKKFTC